MEPLLATKLYVPRVRGDMVSRARLIQRLDDGTKRKLTLISAPAGYGKTTLLSEWAARAGQPVAWLSLDGEDNDPARFWAYLVVALQRVEADLGQDIPEVLRSLQGPPTPALLAHLINQIHAATADTGSDGDLLLVLDDYHVIVNRSIHQSLSYLLDHMPSRLHLILASRTDPPLPLHLLRARRQLAELRAADLRFTTREAAAFLNDVMDLRLSADHVAALERRTEGWITGLQLAALSMEGRDDVSGFVHALTGSHRYVLDYLAEEVLRRQPEPVQTFLLRTSILDRLTGSLCSAVSGQKDGFETLESLEQANLFVIPLDDERRWYRYHHLFAEVLRALLQRVEGKKGILPLHTRAAEWYEEQDDINAALNHAVAAGDVERAACLIEENWLRVGHAGQMNTILRWLESIPQDAVQARPMLSLAYAWALWLTGHMNAVEPHLDAADAIWERRAAAGTLDPENARWRGGIPALRIQLAANRGHLDKAIHFSRRTLELAPPDNPLLRGYGHLGLAHAYREFGDYDTLVKALIEGVSLMRTAGNFSSANLNAFYLSRVLQIQGQLQRAEEVVEEAFEFAYDRSIEQSPASAILHVARASLACERHQLAAAERHLRGGLEMSRLGGHYDYLRNASFVLARLRLAQGDPAAALEAIKEAKSVTPPTELVLPAAELAARSARVSLARGNVSAAAAWAEEAAHRPGQDDGYTRQVEALIIARVLVARGKLDEALAQLAACQQKAAGTGARRWAIEVDILRALVQQARGSNADALAALNRALTAAEPEGYVQIFLDEGLPLAPLLSEILRTRRREAPAGLPAASNPFVRRLLDALDPHDETAVPCSLIEPLTSREKEVLELMAAGLSNRQIADELIVALGTVKSHLHHIYGKLGVNNRTEAAARARDLDLL